MLDLALLVVLIITHEIFMKIRIVNMLGADWL